MNTPVTSFPSFLVNTTVAGSQQSPAMAALSDGRFLVTWVEHNQTTVLGQTFTSNIIRAQYMTATGTKDGAEFTLGSGGSTLQYDPDMTLVTTPTGDAIVVTWTEVVPVLNEYNIYTRLIGINGGPSTTPKPIGHSSTGDQASTTVSVLSDGRFVVAWTDRATPTSDLNIKLSLFTNTGTLSMTTTVNSVVIGEQATPSVTALKGGGYVVTWEDNSGTSTDISGFSVRARIYNASGTAQGTEFVVNSTTSGQQYHSAVAALENGGFVVAFTDGATFSSNSYIRLQVFSATGARVGTEVTVPNEGANIQSEAVVTALSDGRFIVTWTDRATSASADLGTYIRAQVYTAAGVPEGDDFVVNTENRYNQSGPAVTELADGRIAFTWSDFSETGADTIDGAIRGQIFDPRIAAVQVTGTAGNDRYVGSRFDDSLSGAAGNDVLTGNDGNDVLDGGASADRMVGGLGNDTFRIDRTTDVVTEAANGGSDTIISAGVAINLENLVNVENAALDLAGTTAASLIGNAIANRLTGNNGANAITGGAGNDTLVGNGGADDLRGGTGADVMTGGAAADDFIFAQASHAGIGATRDQIRDFTAGSDDIQLDFMAGGRFIGFAAFSGAEDEVRYIRSTGILSGDVNGDRVADWELLIVNKVALTTADIEF